MPKNQIFRAFCPRVRPSVPSMAMVRTMFSPVTRVSLLQVWLSIWLIPLWGSITGIKSQRFDDFGDLQMTSNYPKPINLFRMSVWLEGPCLSAGPLPKPDDAQSLPPAGSLVFSHPCRLQNSSEPHLQGIEDGWQCRVELDLRCWRLTSLAVVGQQKQSLPPAYCKITGQPSAHGFLHPQSPEQDFSYSAIRPVSPLSQSSQTKVLKVQPHRSSSKDQQDWTWSFQFETENSIPSKKNLDKKIQQSCPSNSNIVFLHPPPWVPPTSTTAPMTCETLPLVAAGAAAAWVDKTTTNPNVGVTAFFEKITKNRNLFLLRSTQKKTQILKVTCNIKLNVVDVVE